MVDFQSISSVRRLCPAAVFPVRFAVRQRGFQWARVLPDDDAYRPIISAKPCFNITGDDPADTPARSALSGDSANARRPHVPPMFPEEARYDQFRQEALER